MATRTISTKLAIEGESEYRASLTRINSEIKTLQSALRLTESQYQTNANSMQALTAKGEALSNLYKAQETKVRELKSALENAQKAEQSYVKEKAALIAKIEENNKKLEELRKTTGDTSKEEKALTDENRELTAQLEKCDVNLAAAEKGVNSWQTQLNNAEIRLNDLDAELKLNGEYLKEAEDSTDKCATSIDRFGERVKESADKASELKDALVAAGVIAALKATADALEACVTSAVSFESSMAGVKRTVGGTDEFISALADTFKDLSTQIPITTTELAGIATTAGQLGIAQENVEKFTTVMAQLATTTDLTADNAATMLAQFANITGVTDYERLGSVVAELGDATATTASKVVDMSLGMAAAASIAGMSERDILAISAAVGSLGIEAQAGSTAMSTLISSMYKAVESGGEMLDSFAAVAGMSAREFAEAWGNDPVRALDAFIQGLTDTERNGKSAIMVLEDLGINNVRQTKAILGLASAGDLLSQTINQANNAWEMNTALGEKASVMYNTTEARLTMLSNAFDNVKISVGDKLTPAINTFAEAGTNALVWLADMIEDSDILVPLVTALATAIGVLAAGIVAYTAVTKVAAAAMELFNAVLKANEIFLVVTAVAALAAGIAVLVASADSAVPSVKELTTEAQNMQNTLSSSGEAMTESLESTEAIAAVADRYITKLEELEAAGLKTDEQQKEYHNTLVLLCELIPELSGYIDLETDSIYGGTEALRQNTDAWKKNAEQQAYQERLTELIEKHANTLVEAELNSVRLARATDDLEAAQKAQNETTERMGKLWMEAQEKADAWYEETGMLADASGFLTQEYYDLQNSLAGLGDQIYLAEETVSSYQAAIEADSEAVAAAEDEIALMEEAVENLTNAQEENTAATEENTEAQTAGIQAVQDIKQSIGDLAVAYKDAYDAAGDSINGQIGLFGEFKASLSEDLDTADELMDRWKGQAADLETYSENIKWAANTYLRDGLVQALSDGSAESATYLALIRSDVESSGTTIDEFGKVVSPAVDEFNAAWDQTTVARKNLKTTVAEMKVDLDEAVTFLETKASEVNFQGFHEAVDEAFANVGIDFHTIGTNIGDGLSSGIDDSSGDVSGAATDMMNDMTDAAKSEVGVASPSTVFHEIGENIDQGLEDGIDDNADSVVSSVEDMASDITSEMESGAEDAVNAFDTKFSEIVGRAARQIGNLKSAVTNGMSSLPGSMYSIGTQMVNGMINGIYNRSGSLYYAVSAVVNNAIARARSAAAVASPSKKTTEIFEYVGEGMIVGIENRRKALEEKMQSVVDDALDVDVRNDITDKMTSISDHDPTAGYIRSTAGSTGASNTTNINRGDMIINVYGAEGQNVKELAREVADIIQNENEKEEAVWA